MDLGGAGGLFRVPFCVFFHAISEQLSLANLIFNIRARSEDEEVPAEYDNFYQLEQPNRPTRFTADRATYPTDRDAFLSHSCIFAANQTCAKVPKRFEILGSLSPRSGTLMDLGPCTSFLPWDSGNPGPQNCVMPQDPGNPGPQDFDMQ